MKDRLKALRAALHLTQEDFATRIRTARNTVTGYESGRRVPSNQVISLICREFGVNETWLRTGQGEMFAGTGERSDLAAFAAGRGLTRGDIVLIERILALPAESRKMVIEFMIDFTREITEGGIPYDAPADGGTVSGAGPPGGTEAAEAAYEKSLGIVPETEFSAWSTTDGTQAPGSDKDAG